MTELEKLSAVYAICQVKADYWIGVDMKDEALLTSVFTDDAQIDFSSQSTNPRPDAPLPAPPAFARHCLASLDGVITAHHGHNPRITFTSDSEASAIWPMEDNLWVDRTVSPLPFEHLHGYGFYHDRYRKTDAGWKISATTLKRVKTVTR